MSILENKTNKTFKNRFVITGLVITMIMGLFYYYEQSTIGFPDGHLTEYDRFYKKILYPIFFSLNTLFLLAFILSAFIKKKSKQIFILYISLLVIYLIIKYLFSINLENGQGG